jgi:PhzF family phenazine biosynthesis protein
VQIDACTRLPFKGNATAVCLIDYSLAGKLPDATFRAIAAENNLSETAFVFPLHPSSTFQDASHIHPRFIPTQAEQLCGHDTMKAAAALLFGVLPLHCKGCLFFSMHPGL